jgi:hypothetical protein
MRRIALFFVMLFAIALLANAQSNGAPTPAQLLPSPEAFADGHLAALDKQIGLSEEQKPLLLAVFLQEGKDLIAILGDSSLSEPQKLVRIRQVHVVARKRVWSLLTHARIQRPGHPPPPMLVTEAEPHSALP